MLAPDRCEQHGLQAEKEKKKDSRHRAEVDIVDVGEKKIEVSQPPMFRCARHWINQFLVLNCDKISGSFTSAQLQGREAAEDEAPLLVLGSEGSL